MPAACAACMSRSASPTYTHLARAGRPSSRAACSSGARMRFAMRERVAAHDGVRARVQFHFDEQRIGEPAGLVRDDAPGESATFELLEHRVAAVEQAGVPGELLAIDVQQPHAHRFVIVGRQCAEPEARERMTAVRDLAAHLVERQRRRDSPRRAICSALRTCRARYRAAFRRDRTGRRGWRSRGSVHGDICAARRFRCMR